MTTGKTEDELLALLYEGFASARIVDANVGRIRRKDDDGWDVELRSVSGRRPSNDELMTFTTIKLRLQREFHLVT